MFSLVQWTSGQLQNTIRVVSFSIFIAQAPVLLLYDARENLIMSEHRIKS